MSNELAINGRNGMGFMKVDTFEQAKQIATLMIDSGMIPDFHYKSRNPLASVMMCLQKGLEVGLSPTQSVQDIGNINGRPIIWGDTALALCKVSQDYESCVEEYDEDSQVAICKAKRKGEPEIVRKFSLEDARIANLLSKAIWKLYPKRMISMRARGFALRDTFPHVLKGLHLAEEYIGVKKNIEINPIDRTITINKEEPYSYSEDTYINTEIRECIDNYTPVYSDLISADTLLTLRNLIIDNNIQDEIIDKWLKRAKINHLGELKEEQALKIVSFIMEKEKTNE